MPINAGIKATPESIASIPKTKRGCPAVESRPMVAIKSPMPSESKLLSIEPLPNITAAVNPSNASQKYSVEVKFNDTKASFGAVNIRTNEPKIPPKAAQKTDIPRA